MKSINNCIKKSFNTIDPSKTYKYIIAVSGGTDSQVLLKSFPFVFGKPESCIAVGVNHGIRKEADDELDLAEELAKSIGIKFIRKHIKIETGANLQCRARDGRYAALREVKEAVGAKYITTAHHLSDKVETILIRLLRGKKLGSLNVLPILSGDVFRPMLEVSREDILGYIRRWDLKYANDPSNQDDHYLRVWVRQQLVPMLKSKSPQIENRLLELSKEIASLHH